MPNQLLVVEGKPYMRNACACFCSIDNGQLVKTGVLINCNSVSCIEAAESRLRHPGRRGLSRSAGRHRGGLSNRDALVDQCLRASRVGRSQIRVELSGGGR